MAVVANPAKAGFDTVLVKPYNFKFSDQYHENRHIVAIFIAAVAFSWFRGPKRGFWHSVPGSVMAVVSNPARAGFDTVLVNH